MCVRVSECVFVSVSVSECVSVCVRVCVCVCARTHTHDMFAACDTVTIQGNEDIFCRGGKQVGAWEMRRGCQARMREGRHVSWIGTHAECPNEGEHPE